MAAPDPALRIWGLCRRGAAALFPAVNGADHQYWQRLILAYGTREFLADPLPLTSNPASSSQARRRNPSFRSSEKELHAVECAADSLFKSARCRGLLNQHARRWRTTEEKWAGRVLASCNPDCQAH